MFHPVLFILGILVILGLIAIIAAAAKWFLAR